jgi:hypothetical protein
MSGSMLARGHRRSGESGQSALELIGMLPLLIFGSLLLLQVGAAFWALNSTNEAAREAARAYSLDPNGGLIHARAVANDALPGGLKVLDITDAGRGGHGIRLAVAIPRVLPLPLDPIVREVVMP